MQLTRFVYVFVIVNPNQPDKNIRKDIKEILVNVFNVRLNYLNNYLPNPSRTYYTHYTQGTYRGETIVPIGAH